MWPWHLDTLGEEKLEGSKLPYKPRYIYNVSLSFIISHKHRKIEMMVFKRGGTVRREYRIACGQIDW
jgi:hypothetical protein